MILTPQLLHARALRHQHLAAKVRREASSELGGTIAPRLMELADKLERDAARDDEEARVLSREQYAATSAASRTSGGNAPLEGSLERQRVRGEETP